jgi:dolichol-phosphate mannosyltransferase
MDQEKSDVVYGRRQKRDVEKWFKRWSADIFYRTLEYLSDTEIPRDTGDFRLVSRRVIDVLNQMPERDRFIRGLIAWIGFKQVPFYYDKAQRFAGETKYSLSKMMALAADALTGFSIAPLRLASAVGGLAGLIAILLFAYTVIGYAFFDVVHGWPSIMGTILLFASIQMFFMGIIGEYLGRLFIQSKNRPLYVVREIRRHERPVPQKGLIVAGNPMKLPHSDTATG